MSASKVRENRKAELVAIKRERERLDEREKAIHAELKALDKRDAE
jgi:hypothetical protein